MESYNKQDIYLQKTHIEEIVHKIIEQNKLVEMISGKREYYYDAFGNLLWKYDEMLIDDEMCDVDRINIESLLGAVEYEFYTQGLNTQIYILRGLVEGLSDGYINGDDFGKELAKRYLIKITNNEFLFKYYPFRDVLENVMYTCKRKLNNQVVNVVVNNDEITNLIISIKFKNKRKKIKTVECL